MFLVKTHPVARGIKIGSNQPPQWQSVPNPSFVLGTASNYPPSGTYQSNSYVTDANSDSITITWISGSISGVTWDGGKFVYDGLGSAGTTGSLVLRASDGVDVTDSSAFSIEIVSNLVWSGTPSPSFEESSVTPLNLGAYVTNYNASTDEFSVDPVGTQLGGANDWLTLTPGPGIGSGNLTPNGTQVDSDDFTGLVIRVRRSGGAWVSSAAFGVTVYVAGSGSAEWIDMLPWIYNVNVDESAQIFKQKIMRPLPQTYADWQTIEANVGDTSTWLKLGTPVYGAFTRIVVDEMNGYIIHLPG